MLTNRVRFDLSVYLICEGDEEAAQIMIDDLIKKIKLENYQSIKVNDAFVIDGPWWESK